MQIGLQYCPVEHRISFRYHYLGQVSREAHQYLDFLIYLWHRRLQPRVFKELRAFQKNVTGLKKLINQYLKAMYQSFLSHEGLPRVPKFKP